jgi:hypothetical protein
MIELIPEQHSIFSQLPFEIIREILLYDRHFVIRGETKRLVCIQKIPRTDPRFLLFNTIPRIYERSANNWTIILGKDTRFVMGHRLRPDHIWEYSFVTFRKDSILNMMETVASAAIYQPLYWETVVR